ncbi:hypothetical protein [Paenibacillus brevis]|uniref:Uncharacterized protein n=1 Tax=Paenibacillus brevis TaxID=2841508 RepID=A0ABS6FVR3_9BACL|nr:hypothetical protein [Paenibacillus brevis]MBU5673230.1 hypothetical protein [Paenibacillus brevis]
MWDWFKRNKRLVLGSMALVIIFPIILNYFIFSWRAPGVNGDWMDFLGGYLGAIIGVVVVYTTVVMQLNAQSKESRENKMFQIRPYLRAETIRGYSNNVEQIIFSPATPSDDYISPELANNFGRGQFKLANIGLGTAIDIHFNVDTYMYNFSSRNSALLVKDESDFELSTFLHDTQKFEMNISYSDMLGNIVDQKIEFSTEKVSEIDGYKLRVKRTHPPVVRTTAP